MKKNFKPNTWLYPQPVLVIASYGADGTADGMEAGTADGMTRGATEDGDTVLTTSTTASSSARAAAGSTHRG